MALQMNKEVFITCAVTGSGDTTGKSDKVPITPEQIANSAIDAAKPALQWFIAMSVTRKQASHPAIRGCSAR